MSQNVIVLGWGSLIWDPRELPVSGDWQTDGPWLPVEFARISSGDRLTLVIMKGTSAIPVLWNTLSPGIGLDSAIDSLQLRERCSSPWEIGFLDLENGQARSRYQNVLRTISVWAEEKGFSQVIWTDLEENFEDRMGIDFSQSSAINYLTGLSDPSRAKHYIEMTPAQVSTPLRQHVVYELGWV